MLHDYNRDLAILSIISYASRPGTSILASFGCSGYAQALCLRHRGKDLVRVRQLGFELGQRLVSLGD